MTESREMTLTTHWDLTIEDWKGIFKTILIFLTFHSNTIAGLFNEEEEKKEEKEEEEL